MFIKHPLVAMKGCESLRHKKESLPSVLNSLGLFLSGPKGRMMILLFVAFQPLPCGKIPGKMSEQVSVTY